MDHVIINTNFLYLFFKFHYGVLKLKMRIKYFVNNSNYIFKSKNRRCVLHVYLARQKKNIHIAFDRSLMSLKNTEAILALIMQQRQKCGDQSTQEIVFPRLIHKI